MKFFLDTANLADIKRLANSGIIDGVTTNPTHLSKEGSDPKKRVQEICAALPKGEVSVEITEDEPERVYKQAQEIAQLASNVVVKIPCQLRYFAVMKKLVDEKIAINVTLVFSLIQAMALCKLGVHIISPFVGRLDDIDIDGSSLLYELREMVDHYGFSTQILAASLRHVRHVHEAIIAGADIATMPVEVLEKALEHPLTRQGIEKFNADWKKLGISKFP